MSNEEAYAGQPACAAGNQMAETARAKWKGGQIANMANARGQLWDSYGTAMGQLWDNYGTTMGQLWDNLWDNSFSAGFRAFRDFWKKNQSFPF